MNTAGSTGTIMVLGTLLHCVAAFEHTIQNNFGDSTIQSTI